MNPETVIVALQDDGIFYIRPGLTVGQLLGIADALRELALNTQVNTTPIREPESDAR